jgi:hypothetical protein
MEWAALGGKALGRQMPAQSLAGMKIYFCASPKTQLRIAQGFQLWP